MKSILSRFLMVALCLHTLTGWSPSTDRCGPMALAAEAAQVVTFEGEGEAGTEKKDIAAARSEALENALQDAFRKAMIEILPASLSLEAQERVTEKLSENMRSFLLRYRIVSEMPTENLFFLSVEATFSSVFIQRALAKIEGVGRQEEDNQGSDIRVRVEGIGSFRWYEEVLKYLRTGLPGLRAVKPVEVFGTTAILTVGFSGDSKGLADELLNWRPEEFIVQVKVGDREVTLVLAPNGVPEEPSTPSSPISTLP